MSESNVSRIEVRECLRMANRCDDSQDRWAWLVLGESWALLAETQEIAEANTAQYRGDPVATAPELLVAHRYFCEGGLPTERPPGLERELVHDA